MVDERWTSRRWLNGSSDPKLRCEIPHAYHHVAIKPNGGCLACWVSSVWALRVAPRTNISKSGHRHQRHSEKKIFYYVLKAPFFPADTISNHNPSQCISLVMNAEPAGPPISFPEELQPQRHLTFDAGRPGAGCRLPPMQPEDSC